MVLDGCFLGTGIVLGLVWVVCGFCGLISGVAAWWECCGLCIWLRVSQDCLFGFGV